MKWEVDVKQGLVLVDIQNDYFPGGKMALVSMEQAAQNARRLLQRFRSDGEPVFHIQHISARPGATFFLPNTTGAETHALVKPEADEVVIQKHFPNSFRDTTLLGEIHKHDIDTLVICGAMSHMCIDATTRAAFDLGFTCIVVEDACATRDLEFQGKTVEASMVHASFMAALSGTYAKVMKTDDV